MFQYRMFRFLIFWSRYYHKHINMTVTVIYQRQAYYINFWIYIFMKFSWSTYTLKLKHMCVSYVTKKNLSPCIFEASVKSNIIHIYNRKLYFISPSTYILHLILRYIIPCLSIIFTKLAALIHGSVFQFQKVQTGIFLTTIQSKTYQEGYWCLLFERTTLDLYF